jgi:hypothetical protein
MSAADDRKLLKLAALRFAPDIDKVFPVNDYRVKTLRFWTAEDFRRQDTVSGHAIAAAMERQGVQRLGDLFPQ